MCENPGVASLKCKPLVEGRTFLCLCPGDETIHVAGADGNPTDLESFENTGHPAVVAKCIDDEPYRFKINPPMTYPNDAPADGIQQIACDSDQ